MFFNMILVWFAMFFVATFSYGESLDETPESVLKINTTTNGKIELPIIEIMENGKVESLITENIDIFETTTFRSDTNEEDDLFSTGYEDVTFAKPNTAENVSNVVNEKSTSVNNLSESIDEFDLKFPEEINDEIDVRISRNLEPQISPTTENSLLNLATVVTEINVLEEIDGNLLDRKPTSDELGALNDAEYMENDNIAAEDITNIVKVEPESNPSQEDEVEDMEAIFDERRFSHIKQNGNKNNKEITIFFSETEGDFPPDLIDEKVNVPKVPKEPKEEIVETTTKLAEKTTQKTSNKIEEKQTSDKTKDPEVHEELYSIISSIKNSMDKDKLKGFKITAISTKKLPLPSTTQKPTPQPTDSTDFTLHKSSKTAPYTTTTEEVQESTIIPLEITSIKETEFKENKEEMVETIEYQNNNNLEDINKTGLYDLNNHDDLEGLSPEDVAQIYNKLIEEIYTSFEEKETDKESEESQEDINSPATFTNITNTKKEETMGEVKINTPILNKNASVSIRMGKENEFIFVPSDAYIKEQNNAINITWRGSNNSLNNSIVLRLTEYDNHFLIREIQLNIPKDNEIFTQKKAVALAPNLQEQILEPSRRIVMRDGTILHFSNVDFLKKGLNTIKEVAEPASPRRLYHVEIASICSACVVLLAVALYLVAVRVKSRWLTKPKDQETQC